MKNRHDRLILIFFSDSLPKNTLKKYLKHSDSPLLLKSFFSIFYRNAKISTSCTAKSRGDGEKRMSNSDSAVKKTQKMTNVYSPMFNQAMLDSFTHFLKGVFYLILYIFCTSYRHSRFDVLVHVLIVSFDFLF